jgi:hypothetical protein
MRWEWTRLNLWGIAMRVPMLRLIIRKVEEQRTEFKKYSAEMEACLMCHKLTSHHRGVRMIIHLKIEHGFNEDRAIAIVEDLWREVFILKPRRQDREI